MKYKPYDTLLDTCVYICGIILILSFIAYKSAVCFSGFSFDDIMSPCFFHAITGYYCPGCGGTRSFEYMVSGDFFKSLYYHPIVLYITIPGIFFMLSQTIYRIRRISAKSFRRCSLIKCISYYDCTSGISLYRLCCSYTTVYYKECSILFLQLSYNQLIINCSLIIIYS